MSDEERKTALGGRYDETGLVAAWPNRRRDAPARCGLAIKQSEAQSDAWQTLRRGARD
ncbi:MAG: hypothetical protein ACLUW6_02405 [Coriobacteriaceae bacterium]